MAIEAAFSNYKKQNLIIIIVLLIAGGAWFAYDGYKNPKFQDKHTIDGEPDATLVFHRKAPPYLIGAGLLVGIYFFAVQGRKITVDDAALCVNKLSIPLDSIEKIDKTHFSKKGYFIITYNEGGQSKELKLSDRAYDNMAAVLDHIVAKIS